MTDKDRQRKLLVALVDALPDWAFESPQFTDFPYKKVEDFYFDIHNTRMMT